MEQLDALKRRIESAREMQSLVKVMKTLAAVRVREYGETVKSLAEYNRTIEMGLQVVMKNSPGDIEIVKPSHNHFGAVIFGSEQGLCGGFNEKISAYAVNRMKELAISTENRSIVVVGERVVGHLEEAGQEIEERLSFFEDHLGITQVILKILTKIGEWESKRKIDTIVLFHNMPESGAAFHPIMRYLLPVDTEWLLSLAHREWPGRTIPMFNMDWDDLFSALIRRYLFYSIYRAFVESLASENASRLMAMQAATKNIDERLDELNVKFQNTRQASITSELLDIVTGYEAMEGGNEVE